MLLRTPFWPTVTETEPSVPLDPMPAEDAETMEPRTLTLERSLVDEWLIVTALAVVLKVPFTVTRPDSPLLRVCVVEVRTVMVKLGMMGSAGCEKCVWSICGARREGGRWSGRGIDDGSERLTNRLPATRKGLCQSAVREDGRSVCAQV